MAGNKMNNKKKEDKAKFNKAGQSNDDNEDMDFSVLRKPILTSITGFAQARKIFDQSTEELRGLLNNECDLLYECKVCRNIFRSLVNFISHKRVYCKETFDSSAHGHFIKETCASQELLRIKKLEEKYQEFLKDKSEVISIDEYEDNKRIPMTKDLTQVVEKMVQIRGSKQKKIDENQQLSFQKIPKSSVAVFQNYDSNKTNDDMNTQVNELHDLLSQENAVLQKDGTFKVQSNVVAPDIIPISDDEENENENSLKCKTCNLKFATLKTLKFHMKYKHVENRLVFPCPDCVDIFSTSWSVFRHLFKVHRKTAAQIRRLRETIQAKAFRMNNPPSFYEKRKTAPKIVAPQKMSEQERLDQENQAWLEELHTEENSGRRCGGCGRAFERRAALMAHAHTCARRLRRPIQIQIRRDYHKEQPNPYLPAPRPKLIPDSKPVSEEAQPEIKGNYKRTKETIEDNVEEAEMMVIEIQNEQVDESTINNDHTMESDEVQIKPIVYDSTVMNKLPFSQQAEKSNLNALKQKMLPDIELEKLRCKKCDLKFIVISEFLDHMGGHYKWIRYACKLCNFKHFDFDKVLEHVKIVHKLKGDNDFYFSTVKAIDGAEALELADCNEESSEVIEVSPKSRRPSRCSSDSSRLSDDSSSSSTRIEGARKRKASKYQIYAKKKKENIDTEDGDDKKEDEVQKELENDSSSNPKIFEETSSDMDEVDEKITKRPSLEIISVTSRRPVRNKSKPKNDDFEYDLSNLLRLEAQGYRDYPYTPKNPPPKKKVQQDLQQNYELINKDSCGALVTLSRNSVGKAQAHMKSLGVFKESRISAMFARPMIPKILRSDKSSPMKDDKKSKDVGSPVKVIDLPKLPVEPGPSKDSTKNNNLENNDSEKQINETFQKDMKDNANKNNTPDSSCNNNKDVKESKSEDTDKNKPVETANLSLNESEYEDTEKNKLVEKAKLSRNESESEDTEKNKPVETAKLSLNESKSEHTEKNKPVETAKLSLTESKSEHTEKNKPVETVKLSRNESKSEDTKKETSTETAKPSPSLPLVPIKFRHQGLEVIKNPIIKKNMTDFTKAGMKTKILVIKPINRNSASSLSKPVKFQTIKLKDTLIPNTSKDDKKDQVVVVKVPTVECATKPISNKVIINSNLIVEAKFLPEKETLIVDTAKTIDAKYAANMSSDQNKLCESIKDSSEPSVDADIATNLDG